MYTYGYIRVSSRDQNEDRQRIAMRQAGVEDARICMDKQSGKDFDRPGYRRLLKKLKPGDTLIIKSIDRLGRNYDEILEQWRLITKEKQAAIVVLDMPLLDTRQGRDLTGTLIADIVLQLLSYVAQTEREFIRQRQAEGIAAAKERGVQFGRKPMERPPEYETVKSVWQHGSISAREAASRLCVAHKTFLKWIREDLEKSIPIYALTGRCKGGICSVFRANASLFFVFWRLCLMHSSSERSGALVINIQDDILRLHAMGLLDRLLADKATHGNILWATDAYAQLGEWYSPGNEIRPQRITGDNSDLIKTRARRAMEQRTERTRQHAEVFTPLWVVKKMNDFADEQWFGRKDGIYKYTDEGKIYFSKQKHWKLYVDARRLEITCGEAPFLATRYDMETGEAIPVEERIGLLDRKLRIVSENAQDVEEWKRWALRAVQAIYGYELQGDNLLIARVNILSTVEEHLFHRWRQKADRAWLEKLCTVIAWNLWQMDGIHGCVPVAPTPTEEQLSLFPSVEEQTNLFGEIEKHDIPCRLFDWRGDRSFSYSTLREKGTKAMKFDFIIGNPPYQSDVQNQGDRANPIYDKFMDESYRIADVVELIHPARFLFNAGQTSKQWNQKMLNDEHFTVLHYEPDAATIFPNTDIKGGVAITLRSMRTVFGAIETFTSFPELNGIVRKISRAEGNRPRLDSIIASQGLYRFSDKFFEEFPEAPSLMGKGTGNKIVSSVIEKLPGVFLDEKDGSADFVRFLGRSKGQRVWKWVKREYLIENDYLDTYNLLIPEANNSGKFGETLTEPSYGDPGEGSADTFLSAGTFRTKEETICFAKYMRTKLFRALLGVKKVTQHCPPPVWKMIPLQDFTPASDIDWTKSIPEIDRQLYAKYVLDAAEIEFIETHVKEMS